MHSDLKGLRAKAKAKAERLANGSSGKVDASSYTSSGTPTASDAQTGMKPLSRRAFKRGGKVAQLMGEKAKANVGKKPRSAVAKAPITPNSMFNRDAKLANQQRDGKKVVGALKNGGAAHEDVAADKKLIKSMIKPSAMKKAGGGQTLNTTKNPDGSQQYIKGKDRYERNKTVENAKGTAFKKLWSSKDPAEKEKMRGAKVKLDFADLDDSRYNRAGGGQTVNRAGKGDYAGNYPSDMSAEMAKKIREQESAKSKKEREWENTKAVGKKAGGRAKKADGGESEGKSKDKDKDFGIGNPFKGNVGDVADIALIGLSPAYAIARGKAPGLPGVLGSVMKRGGKAKSHGKNCECKMCYGGRAKKADGGTTTGSSDKVTSAVTPGDSSNAMMKPGVSKFMEKRPGVAKFMEKHPNISSMLSAYPGMAKVMGRRPGASRNAFRDMKAERTARKDGGKVGKTNINITINPKACGPAEAPEQPMEAPPMNMAPPMDMPPPPMPMPPIPPEVLAAIAAKAGGAPPVGPVSPPPFRRGGKVYSSYKDMDAGAGSGEGRLEKTDIAAKSRKY